MAKKEKHNLPDTLSDIHKKFGDDSLVFLDAAPAMDVEALPTGSLGLDWALGVGGYPKGRVIEIFGPESSGKTTLALHAIAEAQRRGVQCAFIDAEHALDPQYARKLGVDTAKLLISQPGSGNEGLQLVEAMVKSGDVGLIVVDSVAALTPLEIMEGEIGDRKVGALARLMSQALSMLVSSVKKSDAIVIFLNQLRMTMMVFPGANPETTSGGRALRFYASVRIDIRKVETIKVGDVTKGVVTKIKVVKNKVAQPFRQVNLDILFNHGISHEGELITWGEKLGVIEGWMFAGQKIGRGQESSREFLVNHPEVAEELEKVIRVKLHDLSAM